jgi:hypothetical protein
MNQARTFFGLLIMIFIAVPVLFGIIWAVGITQAFVSEKTLTELPGEIIAEVPELLDGMMLAARDDDSDMDYDTRAWLNAVAAAGTTPKQLLRETGLNDWLEKELSGSLASLGRIMNGKSAERSVWLDMKPLKAAFSHPVMESWLARVLENLPPCSTGESEAWARALANESIDSLPPCRPGEVQAGTVAAFIRDRAGRDIPDRVNIMENARFPRENFNIARTVDSFAYLLFLIPALFILLGALVGARSKSHFFRWSGAATLAGGGLVLALSSLARDAIPWAMRVGPLDYRYSSHWVHWHEAFVDHAGNLAQVVSRHFMSPVIAVAGGVCIVGLLLFAFSFTFTRDRAT